MGRRALVRSAGEPGGLLEETAEGYTFDDVDLLRDHGAAGGMHRSACRTDAWIRCPPANGERTQPDYGPCSSRALRGPEVSRGI